MQAPDFSLPDQDGTVRSLRDFAGSWLVLYFYPKDKTSGCTTEACNFRDQRDVIAEQGNTKVVGISKDSVESHKAFAEENHLNFPVLSDPAHKVIEAYGAWQPGANDGLGTLRNTVIIDPNGTIAKTYRGVDPAAHAAQIIADLQVLQSQSQ